MSALDLVAVIPLLIIGGIMNFDDYTSLNFYKHLGENYFILISFM